MGNVGEDVGRDIGEDVVMVEKYRKRQIPSLRSTLGK